MISFSEAKIKGVRGGISQRAQCVANLCSELKKLILKFLAGPNRPEDERKQRDRENQAP